MRRLALLFCSAFFMGCVTISDGPFRQVKGHPIDYETVDSFVEGHSSVDNVVARLGEPVSREVLEDGSMELTYMSTKKRESVERVLGKVRGRHVQTMEEQVILVFKDDLLIRKQKSHEVY
jgi:hypothetical protein